MSVREMQMLRRVGVLGVDDSRAFTVRAIGEARGAIIMLFVTDMTTGISYDVYAGVQAYCTAGGTLRIQTGFRNAGNLEGDVFCKLTDDVGTVLETVTRHLVPGQEYIAFIVDATMPGRDYSLTIDVGH